MTKLEKDLAFSFKEVFDTFAGASSSSIILGCFIKNMTLFEAFKYYNNLHNKIYKKQLKMYQKKSLLFKDRLFYDSSILKKEIGRLLDANITFSQISDNKNYFINTVDIGNNKIKIFAKGISEQFDTPNSSVFEAILGSSSAPFHFGPIETKDYELIIDGRLSFINPTLECLIALMSARKLENYKYKVLNLSCPTFIMPGFQRIRANKKLMYIYKFQKKKLDYDRAKTFVEAIVGNKHCHFSEPVFTDAISPDWITPNRYEKHFNHYYYLVRDKIRDFLTSNDIIDKNSQFQLKEHQKIEIDIFIENLMKDWQNKEIKLDYVNYLEQLL